MPTVRTDLDVVPVTADRWGDFQTLFRAGGSWPRTCWCMYWRESHHDAEKNKRAMGRIIRSDRVPGLLAYAGGAPVGWVAIAPRPDFGRIERSRAFNKAPGDGIWSLNCFVIHRMHRRTGIATALLRAAIEHARMHGAVAVEAYPAMVGPDRKVSDWDYTGTVPMFRRAGFRDVAEGSKARVVMRYQISGASPAARRRTRPR